jgi:hypothetical protein
VRLWAQVLLAVPSARLLLKSPSFGDAVAQRRHIEPFAQAGVSADRLLFRGASPLPDMMQEYADVDIALVPVPYTGGTTTLQAMWMGVPAVVLAGGGMGSGANGVVSLRPNACTGTPSSGGRSLPASDSRSCIDTASPPGQPGHGTRRSMQPSSVFSGILRNNLPAVELLQRCH